MSIEKIEKFLDESIRPQLQMHGGDIETVDFIDGVLRYRLLGQCANCPSAKEETELMISEVLTENIPEIKEVVRDQFISEDLLEMARKILRHEQL